MIDEIPLQWFDREKFNRRITKKEDKIGYDQILVSKSKTNKGIQHIQERHIDDIVKCFCAVWVPEPQSIEPVQRYMENLSLSGAFREYYDSMVSIAERIEGLTRKIDYSYRDFFRAALYGLDLPTVRRLCALPEAEKEKMQFKHRESTSLMTGGLLYRKPQWGGFSSVLKNHRVTQATGLERA